MARHIPEARPWVHAVVAGRGGGLLCLRAIALEAAGRVSVKGQRIQSSFKGEQKQYLPSGSFPMMWPPEA